MSSARIDQRALRDALGRFATGIAVVGALDASDAPVGMTVNSFAAVSLEPPLVLWSIARNALSFATFSTAEHFAVSVLRAHEQALSNHFATPAENKFAGVDWHAGLGGAPVLRDPLASFECRTRHRYDGGDHLILVGQVERFASATDTPLLFYAGRYTAVGDAPGPGLPDDAVAPFADLLL